MLRSLAGALTALLISMTLAGTATAETKPKDMIKYRHAVMEAMGGHTGAFSLVAFGRVDMPSSVMQNHAMALADLGAEVKNLFPEGSGGKDSHALPAIWEQPEAFAKAVAEAEEAAAGLKAAASSGDRKAMTDAFSAVGKSCKGCHENFREEHDH